MPTSLPPKALVLIALFVGFHLYLGWASFRSRGRVAAMPALPPLRRHYTSLILLQLLLLVVALTTAWALRLGLFPGRAPGPVHLTAGLATAVALAALMYPRWKNAVARGDRHVYFFMPVSGSEKLLWVGVSLAAAVGEEITYRGVMYAALATVSGQPWLAAVLSAIVFALAHAFQSRLSMAFIFGFALVFQALAIWSGALYVPMLAHFVYDVIAGLTYSRLGRTRGYRPLAAPAATDSTPVGTAPTAGA